MALLILAGLQMLPGECYEAARVDGVHPLRVFWKVTLPLLKPALLVAIIFRALDALRIFDLIYVLTGNNKSTMSMSVYARQQLVDFQDVGFGSAAATMLFADHRRDHRGLSDRRPRRPGGLSHGHRLPPPGAVKRRVKQTSAGSASTSCWSSSSSTRCSRSTGRSSPRCEPAPACSRTDLLPSEPDLEQLRRRLPASSPSAATS